MSNTNHIRTTALIDEASFIMLSKAGILSENQRNKIISLVLKAVLRKFNSENKPLVRSSVKYQSILINSRVIHYEVEADIYEACLDLRKSNKLSVSKMINDGIKDFLDSILSLKIKTNQNHIDISNSPFQFLDNYPIEYNFSSNYDRQKSILTTIIKAKTPPLTIQTISLHFHHDSFT
ncbi:MAG: hypothetical protein KA015_04665 [Spirochaetes bacterium]|nr:hypothetical protein [Spirochaetota bacterium]